jgi:phage-related protein
MQWAGLSRKVWRRAVVDEKVRDLVDDRCNYARISMNGRGTTTQAHRVGWVIANLDDLRKFPELVRAEVGFALYQGQRGGRHVSAKALKGFGSSGVLEIVTNHDGNAFRAVYTVHFEAVVYVLHFRRNLAEESRHRSTSWT